MAMKGKKQQTPKREKYHEMDRQTNQFDSGMAYMRLFPHTL